jgi:pSer/pThr/pTyr-binding forkhead associated (FHA) protein
MPKPTWRLIVREPNASERKVDVDQLELSVGRHPGSDLCLQDPSVSGQHARLWLDGGVLRVKDLGSRNATQVEGGAKLRSGMSAGLGAGDVLLLGETRLEVRALGVGAADASHGPGSTFQLMGREAGPWELLDVGSPMQATAQYRPSEALGEDPTDLIQAQVLGRRARLTLCGRGIHAVVDIPRVPFVVGRKAAAGIDYVLDHEQVSTRHLRIEYMSGRFHVRDLGSSNGTRVEGLSVVGDFPTPLGQDAVIEVGPVRGLFYAQVDDAGRSADLKDFERAADALLDGGLIEVGELERARRILRETHANRHLGEILLSQQDTRLRIQAWLQALAAVRDPEWGGAERGRAGWRALFGAASGWLRRERPSD